MNSYELSRSWFNWCFENPEKINPNHSALYFFIIEHCNRLGWKEKFGLPMEMCKDAIGIKNYRTYIKTFNDLIEWGFIELVQKSKNQYSSNIIAIVKNTKAHTKALDKAMQKHSQKHSQKQGKSIVGIDKPYNKDKPETRETFIYSEFYDLQISNSEKEVLENPEQKELFEKYINFVKWLFGKDEDNSFIKNNLLHLEKQLTFNDFKKLINLSKQKNILLMDIFKAMENYKNLKYKTISLTAEKWIKNSK